MSHKLLAGGISRVGLVGHISDFPGKQMGIGLFVTVQLGVLLGGIIRFLGKFVIGSGGAILHKRRKDGGQGGHLAERMKMPGFGGFFF